ncbi:MAG: hypothetical protein J7J96_08445 [Sulfurimonas sp.]|nr:hypothetical protein [Sulfurimonas sp.]
MLQHNYFIFSYFYYREDKNCSLSVLNPSEDKIFTFAILNSSSDTPPIE